MLDNLSTCTTWECVNSFSSWVAALGTILISGLALWLSWRDGLIRIRASFDYGLVPGGDPNKLDREVYILEFTNIGRRSTTVTNYEWRIRKWPLVWKYNRWFSFPHLEAGLGNLCSKFPVELTDGKSGHIFHKAEFFAELEDKEKHLFSSCSAVALIRILDFKIAVRTTTGKRVNVKIPFRVRKHIWKRYLKAKT